MIKTVTVNVAGQVFHIDEDAFDALSAYLKTIKKMYGKEEGGDEILADIESRIAEVFIEKLKLAGKTVVSLADVEHVIAMLGRPEELEDGEGESREASTESGFDFNQKAEKRLYRNPDDQVIAGVCSGLASYFGISDPIWIRLLFIILVVTGIGSGALIYIILWIIVPEAKTTAQKLQMKGEPVNLENLEKSFKEGMQNFENNIQNIKEDSTFNQIIRGLGQVVATIAKAVFIFLKGLILFISAVVGFAVVVVLFTITVAAITTTPFLNDVLFENPLMGVVGIIGLVMVLATISISLVLIPFQLFSKRAKPFRKEVNLILTVLTIVGTIMLFAGAMNVIREFNTEESLTKTTDIPDTPALDTLIIRALPKSITAKDLDIRIGWLKYEIDGEENLFGKVKVHLEASPDSSFHILENYSAKGADRTKATKNVRNMAYDYKLNGNQLLLSESISARVGHNKWRDQEVNFTLQVPEGTILVFSEIAEMIKSKPAVKSNLVHIPLESTAWKIEQGFLVPLDTNIVVDESEEDKLLADVTPSTSFNNVEISGYINAEIIGGSDIKVLTNSPDKFSVKVRGDKLVLQSNPSIYSGNRKAPKVKIYMPIPDEIDLTGLCDAEVSGFNRGDLKVTASGSSTVSFNGTNIDKAIIELNGVSNFKGFGKINDADIQASGSSSIRTLEIEMDRLKIDLSGASDAEVNVADKISGEISGASTLSYKGRPNLQVNSSGAAKIKSIQ